MCWQKHVLYLTQNYGWVMMNLCVYINTAEEDAIYFLVKIIALVATCIMCIILSVYEYNTLES